MKQTKYAGTQTEKNLLAAFAGESEARNKYTFFASKARKEGYEQIAALFLKTAENEKEHAKLWFKELEGIGDTMRISLTDDPVVEVRACWTLLGALDLRRRTPELISCPTCGRCQVNLIGLAQEVEERLAAVDKPVKVAVMGCVVNGPGEAADADIGVACGAGAGVVFSHGKIVRKVQESEIVSALMEELENL